MDDGAAQPPLSDRLTHEEIDLVCSIQAIASAIRLAGHKNPELISALGVALKKLADDLADRL